VRNIVSNAVKYSRPGAGVCVSVSGDPRSGRAALRVRDVGVGVPAEDLPRVFDKFYRAPAHRQLAQGTGLGLNLVKLVVEQVHDGEVTVRSEPGKGSEFGFSVPLFEPARRRAAPAAKAGEPPKRQDSQSPSATGDNPNPGSEP
jgi:signal transduction histidine kinase